MCFHGTKITQILTSLINGKMKILTWLSNDIVGLLTCWGIIVEWNHSKIGEHVITRLGWMYYFLKCIHDILAKNLMTLAPITLERHT